MALAEAPEEYCEHASLRSHSGRTRKLLAVIRVAGPALDGAALGEHDAVHLDFHRRNVLIDGEHVSAVIDREGYRSGDRFCDLVTLAFRGPIALLHVLDTFVDTPLEAFGQIDVPTLVIAGDAEVGRGSVAGLAAAIPGSRLRLVAGDHLTALTSPELSDEIVRFLLGEAGPHPG